MYLLPSTTLILLLLSPPPSQSLYTIAYIRLYLSVIPHYHVMYNDLSLCGVRLFPVTLLIHLQLEPLSPSPSLLSPVAKRYSHTPNYLSPLHHLQQKKYQFHQHLPSPITRTRTRPRLPFPFSNRELLKSIRGGQINACTVASQEETSSQGCMSR